MTFVGVLSFIGLCLVGAHIVRHMDDLCTCIVKGWFALLASLVAVTLSAKHGLGTFEHAVWYALCAAFLGVWSWLLFNRTATSGLFAAIFILNGLLNFTQLPALAAFAVDLTDLLYWLQVLLLHKLCGENPNLVRAHE